jgi:membrane protein DedA with SNARE-associated domain
MAVFHALLPLFTDYGYLAVFFVLLLCGFGLPLPEDITLVAGGVIAGLGYANEHAMVLAGLAGVLLGDGATFTFGRLYGERLLRRPLFRRVLTPARINSAQTQFTRHGRWVMFVARFLPGLRTPVYFTAGMSRCVSYPRWLLMDGTAALLSVPVWVYLGYLGARNFDWLFTMVTHGQHIILGAVLSSALVVAAIWWRRRREAAGKDGQ